MKIKICQGDILRDKGEAIVCPTDYAMYPTDANSLAYKIYKIAGEKDIREECLKFRGCGVGKACITPAFKFDSNFKYIIHVVGPKGYSYNRVESRKMLSHSYTSVLNCAKEKGIKSVTMPCLGIGHKGYSRQEQAKIALDAIYSWDEENKGNTLSIDIYTQDPEQADFLQQENNERSKSGTDANKKIGLVLAGGGAKGAFQLGAWQALEKHGIDKDIVAISGTSIGAINAYLFAAPCDYEKKKKVWLEFEKHELTKDRKQKKLAKKVNDFNKSLGDTEWEKRILYSTLTEVRHLKAHRYYEEFGNKPFAKQLELLMSSAAHPGLYNGRKQPSGGTNIDGGTLSAEPIRKKRENTNVPIQPLYDLGIRKFIVIYLHSLKNVLPEIDDEIRRYGDADICRVFPLETLGKMTEINRELTEDRIRRGYEAMCAQIEHGLLKWKPKYWEKPFGDY